MEALNVVGLSHENAVNVKNLIKMDKIYRKKISCILFSLNWNFKTLERLFNN